MAEEDIAVGEDVNVADTVATEPVATKPTPEMYQKMQENLQAEMKKYGVSTSLELYEKKYGPQSSELVTRGRLTRFLKYLGSKFNIENLQRMMRPKVRGIFNPMFDKFIERMFVEASGKTQEKRLEVFRKYLTDQTPTTVEEVTKYLKQVDPEVVAGVEKLHYEKLKKLEASNTRAIQTERRKEAIALYIAGKQAEALNLAKVYDFRFEKDKFGGIRTVANRPVKIEAPEVTPPTA